MKVLSDQVWPDGLLSLIWEVYAAHINKKVEDEAENQNAGSWHVLAGMNDKFQSLHDHIIGCRSLRIIFEEWKCFDEDEIHTAWKALG
jgi:hypothetical protein